MKILYFRSSTSIVSKVTFFVAFIILLGFMAMPSETHASSFVFQNKVITVEKGKTFTMPVTIDPSGEKNYTVRFTLGFPPDILEVTSFTFAPSWLAIAQPGYDLIDNKNGQFIKTAGFPKGFSVPESFGTITFRAKAAGESTIIVGSQSFVLNAQNASTLEFRPQIRVVASEGSAPKASSIEPLPNLPPGEKNLFDIISEPIQMRVAPGGLLPISVKLSNFGGNKRADVLIGYSIFSSAGKEINSASETVAVETTANFVKTIQIPFNTVPGIYTAKTSITYEGQLVPATTQFPFTVERKILGLFQSDFLLYGGITLLVSVLMLLLGHALIKRRRGVRFTPFDYSDILHDQRTFYEILSDTIMEMRERVGDDALKIASDIPGLKIDKENGRVLTLTEHPSKIIATLVSEYEKLLGKKVSFSFRREKTDL